MASKLTLQGPVVKDKTAFIVSGRRTYIDLLAQPIIKNATDGEGSGGYYFYDLNAKVNHKFSERDRLYLVLIQEKIDFMWAKKPMEVT